MADYDVEVKFGANTGELNAATKESTAQIVNFYNQMEQLGGRSAGAGESLKKAAHEAEGLSVATAGATREFIVLGHEMLKGNFSRIPGSLMVLGERTGGLHTIIESITPAVVGWTAAIGAAIVATYEWAAASERLAETQQTVRGAMELNNQGLSYNAGLIDKDIVGLRLLGGMSTATASEIVTSFARAGQISNEFKQKLISITADYAAATGEEAPKAAEELIKMFSEPGRGAVELAEKFRGVLSPEQFHVIENFVRSGQVMQAQGALFDALGSKISGFANTHLTFLEGKLRAIHTAWVALTNPSASTSLMGGAKVDPVPGPTPEQQDAAKGQEHQNQLNQALFAGLAIEQQAGLLVARKNRLLQEQAGLVRAANAASETGDSQSAKRYLSDAAEIQEQINNLRAKGQKQDVEAEIAAIQEKLTVNKIYLGEKKDLLQSEVDLGKKTKTQELADLRVLTDQEYALNLQALQDETQIAGLSVKERQRINNEILTLQAQHERDLAALTLQGAAAQQAAIKKTEEEYKAFFNVIDRDMDQMLQGVLQGTQTWQQAMARMFSNLSVSFIEDVGKMMLKWAAFEAAQAAFNKDDTLTKALGSQVPTALGGTDKDSVLGAAMTKLGTFLGLNTAAHTAGTAATTGNAVATASNTVATVTDTAVTGTGTVATTASTLATTVNTTTTASSGLLHVAALAENTIATAANTIATDLLRFVEGVKTLLGFDVGTWSVPSTGAALIHQGEIILPPGVSSAVRAGTMQVGNVGSGLSPGGGGGTGAGGDQYTIQMTVNALDGASVANVLQSSAGTKAIVRIVNQQVRNFNPKLTNAFK